MKTRKSILVMLVVLLAQSWALAKDKSQFMFTLIDPPGSVYTIAAGINNNGVISGQFLDGAGVWHSFILKHGEYTVIDVPGAAGTGVSAPNMQGQIALGYWGAPDYFIHAAVYSKGQFTLLPDAPGELNVSPDAINASGHISGVVWSDNFTIVHSYLWDGTTYTIYDHPLSDVNFTIGWAINNHDQIAGQYNTSDGMIHGYLKDGANYTEIAFPGALNTNANGINNSGAIVGSYGEAIPGPLGYPMGSHGFILWKGIYTPLDYPDATATFLLGINDTGQIVGSYLDATGLHSFLATSK